MADIYISLIYISFRQHNHFQALEPIGPPLEASPAQCVSNPSCANSRCRQCQFWHLLHSDPKPYGPKPWWGLTFDLAQMLAPALEDPTRCITAACMAPQGLPDPHRHLNQSALQKSRNKFLDFSCGSHSCQTAWGTIMGWNCFCKMLV